MKHRLDLIAALTISLVVATLAVAEPVSHNMAARTELHAIESMTLSDAQFLTGDAKGTPTATTGELRVAAGSGRLPLVMLQHGSGGMGANLRCGQESSTRRAFRHSRSMALLVGGSQT